jgi:hypothetical protein
VRLPPIITWSDVSWILFIVAGVGFLYAVVGVIALSATLPDPWDKIVFGVALAAVLALIALELRRFWRFRR